MINLVFWDYKYLHNKIPLFILKDFYNLSLTLDEIIIRNYNSLTNGIGKSIKVLKVDKRIPKELININEPYFNKNTKINDYINYYEIKSSNCDIIIEIL
jgi:hypothetical protein